MSFFDSIVHAMTTIATGGFANYNESIGYFNSSLIEINAIIFIILGSIPFISYIKYLAGDKKIFFKDTQIKTFIILVIISILLMFFYLSVINKSLTEISFLSVSFNIISILTGTGYATENFSNWGQFPLVYFIILMFIGGCAGSTTCGIKIFRIQILYQFISNQLKKIIYPRGIFKIKYQNNNVDEKFMDSIISFIFLFKNMLHRNIIFYIKSQREIVDTNCEKQTIAEGVLPSPQCLVSACSLVGASGERPLLFPRVLFFQGRAIAGCFFICRLSSLYPCGL